MFGLLCVSVELCVHLIFKTKLQLLIELFTARYVIC